MENKHELPEAVAKKYRAKITPTKVHFNTKDEKGNKTHHSFDMRQMSLEQAEILAGYGNGKFLEKITKETAEPGKK